VVLPNNACNSVVLFNNERLLIMTPTKLNEIVKKWNGLALDAGTEDAQLESIKQACIEYAAEETKRADEAESKLAEIEAGCDIQKSHGLFRQTRVIIGQGITQPEIERDQLKADCVVMREALLTVNDWALTAEQLKAITPALSTSAGKELLAELEQLRKDKARLLKCCDFDTKGEPVIKGSTLHLHTNRQDGTICKQTLEVPEAKRYCWHNTEQSADKAVRTAIDEAIKGNI
jgi:hypothetical protein